MKHSDKELEQKITEIITKVGFNIEKVKTSSFWELENSLSIDHYKLTKFYPYSTTSNVEVEQKLKIYLKNC